MSKKVLLIEDSQLDAALIKDILDKNGIDAYVAATCADGFKKCVEIKPDLVLLDLILPDGSGFDLCKRIRTESGLGKDVLILVLSVKNELADIEKAFESGADDYVVKPPSPEPLLRKIQLYLHGKG